jgi:FkbM family methyltransferase
MDKNYGHLVLFRDEIFNTVPQYFALTDPDLEYPESLPYNFIETLANLTDEFNVAKAGLALKIPDLIDSYPDIYYERMTIRDWEKQFWNKSIEHPNLEIYSAPIDTTFAVYNKSINNQLCLRVAGIYMAKHLPWYKEYIHSIAPIDLFEAFGLAKCSTIARIIMKNFESSTPNLQYVTKNDLTLLVELDGSEARDGFWVNHYQDWEPETFNVFDRYVTKDAVTIDIGTWIGPTVLYVAQKCKKVIAVEADQAAASTLKRNISCNGLGGKVKVLEMALYSDESGILFGPNSFRPDDGLNASTSQILSGDFIPSELNQIVPTVTWPGLIRHLDPSDEVCLIKLDIEGGEEFVLREVLHWAYHNRVPAYVSFHLTWWKDQDLDRFNDLFVLFGMESTKAKIIADPFVSIVFRRKDTPIAKYQIWLIKQFKKITSRICR